jgi:hypothetical protein
MSVFYQKKPTGASVPPSPLDAREVKRAADFVAIVSRYTRLRRCGGQFVGLCPFHPEGRPSFYVEPRRKIFHCFGCNASGDVFDFIVRAERCNFRRALLFASSFLGGSGRQPARKARGRSDAREGGPPPLARGAGGPPSPCCASHVHLVSRLAATERRLSAIRVANEAAPLACAADRADCGQRSRVFAPLLETAK